MRGNPLEYPGEMPPDDSYLDGHRPESPSTLQLLERVAEHVNWLSLDKAEDECVVDEGLGGRHFVFDSKIGMDIDVADKLLGAICADCRRRGWDYKSGTIIGQEGFWFQVWSSHLESLHNHHESRQSMLHAALQAYLKAVS